MAHGVVKTDLSPTHHYKSLKTPYGLVENIMETPVIAKALTHRIHIIIIYTSEQGMVFTTARLCVYAIPSTQYAGHKQLLQMNKHATCGEYTEELTCQKIDVSERNHTE